MKFLLDTSTCVAHLRGRWPRASDRLAAEAAESTLCSVVRAELLFGVLRSADPIGQRKTLDRFLGGVPSLGFDDAAAGHAGRIRAELAAAGTPVGPHDVLIAAIAMANGLIMVTCNTAEFERVKGLRVEDWVGA